jgi:5'-nucleotidase
MMASAHQAYARCTRRWKAWANAAPLEVKSGCGHQVTTHAPISVAREADGNYAIGGTPADCVRLAMFDFAKDADWVLSGVNAGGNLGADIFISGTAAGAREAVFQGKPGIAISHYKKKELEFDWKRCTEWIRPLLIELLAKPLLPRTYININIPQLPPGAARPEVVRCPADPSRLDTRYRMENGAWVYDGNYHKRPRLPDLDVDVCMNGKISLTELKLF